MGVERIDAVGPTAASRCARTGYPDFPMPQQMRTDGDGHKVLVSCLVSDLVFEWRLEPLGDGTRIAVHVEIPEAEAAPAGEPARRGERTSLRSLAALASIYGRASSTMLNGVSAARRTRQKPPSRITSVSRASPAWAPSASPTSWLSDAGVQSIVDAA